MTDKDALWRARAMVICLSAFVVSCGSSPATPSSPSASTLPFQVGTYYLQFMGCEATSVARIPPVTTELNLTLENGEWRGRSRSAEGGSFDLRLIPGELTPGGPGGGPGVAGTLTGMAITTTAVPLTNPVPDSRVIFGDQARGSVLTLGGGASRDGLVAGGRTSGDISFGQSTGTFVSCNGSPVGWFLTKSGN